MAYGCDVDGRRAGVVENVGMTARRIDRRVAVLLGSRLVLIDAAALEKARSGRRARRRSGAANRRRADARRRSGPRQSYDYGDIIAWGKGHRKKVRDNENGRDIWVKATPEEVAEYQRIRKEARRQQGPVTISPEWKRASTITKRLVDKYGANGAEAALARRAKRAGSLEAWATKHGTTAPMLLDQIQTRIELRRAAERDRARQAERAKASPAATDKPVPAGPRERAPDVDAPFAALYVDPKGPYADLTAAWYDEARDARTYDGDLPVVAHPPCGPWGKLAWRCTNQDRQTGHHAVQMVRRNGGILEHPVGSQLFAASGIPVGNWDDPEREIDDYGGYTIRVPQWHWGHRGEKDTILYVVGAANLPPLPLQTSETKPRPVQNMGKLERRLTPPAMAHWMASVAYRCRGWKALREAYPDRSPVELLQVLAEAPEPNAEQLLQRLASAKPNPDRAMRFARIHGAPRAPGPHGEPGTTAVVCHGKLLLLAKATRKPGGSGEPPFEGAQLLPSKKNPKVRRWQKVAEPTRSRPSHAELIGVEDEIRHQRHEHARIFAGGQWHRVGSEYTQELGYDPTRMLAVPPDVAAVLHGDPDAVFTHNHPSGRPLSAQDIHLCAMMDPACMRAVGPSGVAWEATRPTNGWRSVAQELSLAYRSAEAAAESRMDRIIMAHGGVPKQDSGSLDPTMVQHIYQALCGQEFLHALEQTLGNSFRVDTSGVPGAADLDHRRLAAGLPHVADALDEAEAQLEAFLEGAIHKQRQVVEALTADGADAETLAPAHRMLSHARRMLVRTRELRMRKAKRAEVGEPRNRKGGLFIKVSGPPENRWRGPLRPKAALRSLLALEGRAQLRALGVTRAHYRDPVLARRWRDAIATLISGQRPESWRPAMAKLERLYRRMTRRKRDPNESRALAMQVQAAYRRLAVGRGAMVKLADLREALPDVPRKALDAELVRLARDRRILLEPNDNAADVTERDRGASVRLGGEDNHWFAWKLQKSRLVGSQQALAKSEGASVTAGRVAAILPEDLEGATDDNDDEEQGYR